ncbi:hypothetical protein C0Q70_00956 [Pomacea canaliculata]|uniref:Uncharacterized protein n=1 Tax=Pomacea canaliculata TaxID=400727 RepID=A0A2T7PY44_POMCA|nr:D-beta-hydroxybutyrate dehydrogenase, mitochondrial-like [Pomacea canaliculata]XP_025097513.1 D-beta-hydroxybutyrate dehydrogenase, mitochondrial-like [Pomacea canaliculata]PVD38343.1 hypothetical protein C0Q70_00956 [Pomacea canaliculata]
MLHVLGALALAAVVLFLLNVIVRRRTVIPGGKAVLITGCDHGFGCMLAEALDILGYRVFAGCLNAAGDGAKELKQKTSSNLVIVQLDVTSDVQVAEARATVERSLDGCCMWAVINNAGIAAFAETEWCSLDAYQNMMDVNWMGTVRVTKTFLPLVRAARGRIINVVSLAGRIALPGFTSYSSSKFALIGFSDSLRREMIKFGVKVITIEPTLYRTALSDCDALTRQNERMWNMASEEVRHDYGETYFRSFLTKLKYVPAILPAKPERSCGRSCALGHLCVPLHPLRARPLQRSAAFRYLCFDAESFRRLRADYAA